MKRTLLALCAIAALTTVSAGVVSAQELGVGPGGVYVGPGHDRDRGFRRFGERDDCHVVITHRRGPNGSITTRRRVCD